MDKENEYFIFVAPGPDRCLESTDNVKIIELSCRGGYPVWEQYALPRAVRKVKADILHCTSNTAPVFCDIPLILTLHDIIFLEKKRGNNPSLYQKMGWYYRRLVVPAILNKCKKIITVSEFERKRIKETLSLPHHQIVSVYNGFSKHFKPVKQSRDITSSYVDSDSYLFFLGNTDPKKNTSRVLKAYSIYLKYSSRKLPLLIADLKEESVTDILKKEGIEDILSYLRFPGYIKNTDLPAVFSGAFAFLYPSLRESFGIPMLEAMACGTPVITSDISAIPEVAGDGAILVDPYKPEDIAEAVLSLEKDESLYHQRVKAGFDRTACFSWEKTADNLLSIYNEVFKNNRKQNK